jgi:hypothetical protein
MYSYLKSLSQNIVAPLLSRTQTAEFSNCKRLVEFSQTESRLLGTFPQASLNDNGLKLYFQYEILIDQCFSLISVASISEPDSRNSVSPALVKQTLWNADIPDREITLLAAWQSMNQKFWQKELENEKLLQKALDERVGFYSTEEEADNMALDWLYLLGKDPQKAVNHWLAFASQKDGKEQQSKFNFSFQRCLKLYSSDPRWSEDGHTVPIPVGSFAEDHHSGCFRIYNLVERIRLKS